MIKIFNAFYARIVAIVSLRIHLRNVRQIRDPIMRLRGEKIGLANRNKDCCGKNFFCGIIKRRGNEGFSTGFQTNETS